MSIITLLNLLNLRIMIKDVIRKDVIRFSCFLHCWECRDKEKFDLEYLVWNDILLYCHKNKVRLNKVIDIKEANEKLKLESAGS